MVFNLREHVVQDGIIETINFVGAGNTFLVDGGRVDISIAGGSGGAWWYDYDVDTLRMLVIVILELNLLYHSSNLCTHQEVTVDIEPGVTVTVDDGTTHLR